MDPSMNFFCQNLVGLSLKLYAVCVWQACCGGRAAGGAGGREGGRGELHLHRHQRGGHQDLTQGNPLRLW